MKKVVDIISLCCPILASVLCTIAGMMGMKEISIWTLLIWTLLCGILVFMVLSMRKRLSRDCVWNVVTQKFDSYGNEAVHDIKTFGEEKLATEFYMSHLMNDMDNPAYNVEKTPGVDEYWYDNKDDNSFGRCVVMKSKFCQI